MKKLINILLSTVMLAAILLTSACGNNGGKTSTIPLDVDFNSKPTLKIHLQATGYTDEAVNKDFTAKKIEELTGYKAVYSQIPASDSLTAINLAIINRTPLHAIKVTKSEYNSLLSQEALLDIKPALEKYGKDLLADISEYSWSVVEKDGGIYGIPEGGPPNLGQENVVDSIIFRQDLIWNEGLDVPKTRDEFTSVLRHFKSKMGAEYRPFTFNSDLSLIPAIAVSFGIYQEWSLVNGSYVFYLEHPNYKDYMSYMTMLMNEGLIDLDVTTQDKVGALNKFGKGNAIAYAGSLYELNTILNTLRINNLMSQNKEDVKDVISAVAGFTAPDGKTYTYHRGGYQYVTVIPWYMNEEAAYTVDYLNKKIHDETFREIVIGEKDSHYLVTNNGYEPIYPKFKEKEMASFLCTGINERTYGDYFACRVFGDESYVYIKSLNKNADNEGVYNPLNFTNFLPYYDTVSAVIQKQAHNDAMSMMFVDKNLDGYDAAVKKFRTSGGERGAKELNEWCKKNWENKFKVR